MSQLKGWLQIGGGFFVLLALVSLSPVRPNPFVGTFLDPLGQQAPFVFGFPIAPGILFGLELGLIGLMLILASHTPYWAINLIYPIIATEILRNVLNSLDMTGPDGFLGFYTIFIIIHLLILVIGVAFLQQKLVQNKRLGLA